MDRHTCKLCFRRFSNGRALGGHMRSHATSATIAASQKAKLPQEYYPSPSLSASSSPSPSSCSSASRGELEAAEQVAQVREHGGAALAADGEVEAGAEEAKQLVFYGLRENPKKSFRLVDPAFSSTFAAAEYVAGGGGGGGGSSVMLQDWESETESSKPLSLRRRSKRSRRFSRLSPGKPEASFEPEPVSSVSDTTPEEDVARCLMMLSRDVWTTDSRDELVEEEGEEEEEEEEEEEQPSDDSEEKRAAVARSRKGGRSRYQCGTCRKVFRSYQALGGHRASHKKIRACAVAQPPPPSEGPSPVVVDAKEEKGERAKLGIQILDADSEVNARSGAAERRIHQCPVCFRVFSSGQALGGHKRSHLGYSSAATNPSTVQAPISTAAAASSSDHVSGTTKLAGESLIDLNLPAPMDEEVELCSFR
ncbi:hypothetical protein Taro_053911 [Colocasia esculenta]|uniref:C2H2-type domain-containing protein n=1 Tax=Colocasia esculenta TaxID=4460 RepID=A0A843XP09_COLES|nr:hypothetical protein [Colocasia esculenta]